MKSAFTLIEVAISALILIIGLSAALSLTLVGLDWGHEINVRTNVINTARAVLDDIALIDASANSNEYTTTSGYLNGLYIVRKSDPYKQEIWTGSSRDEWKDTSFEVSNLPGFFANITVEVWQGVINEDLSTGGKIFELKGTYYETAP